jgi:hypothetical protein
VVTRQQFKDSPARGGWASGVAKRYAGLDMPTRKQRRRRDKAFRHEYELVTYDDEGNEVAVEPSELRKKDEAPKAKGKPQQRGARPVREVPPPSWRRAVRRGGLMGAGLLVVMSLLKMPVLIGVIYAAALIPFTYWIDRVAHRNYLRRSGKTG